MQETLPICDGFINISGKQIIPANPSRNFIVPSTYYTDIVSLSGP